METLNYVASIWGFALIVIPLALLINPKHLERVIMQLENDSNLFLWGIVAFVLGSAMVLNYNAWDSNWTVIITILGWLSLLKGLFLLFFPNLIKRWALKIAKGQWLSVWLVVIVFVGLLLTYFSFTA